MGRGLPRARLKGDKMTPLRVPPAKQAWPPTPSRPGVLSTADLRTGLSESPVTLGTESCCDNSRLDFAGEASTKLLDLQLAHGHDSLDYLVLT